MGTWTHGHAGIPAGDQTHMCTHCDRTCVKERFPSIYPFAQADLAQLVEHNLAKVGVAGSSPVVRSSEFSSAVSPGEAALFVVVVTQDRQSHAGQPHKQAREVWSRRPLPRAFTHEHTRSARKSPGDQARKASWPPGLRGRYVNSTDVSGNPCYFVTMTETSSLMVL